MTRFTKWSPTTQPLPAPVKFGPRVSGLLPTGMMPVTPMAEAPTDPGVYIIKLTGVYRPSLMAYNGPQAAERMEADHRAGVAFYCRYTGGK